MGVQDIIVMIILAVCVIWIGRHTYRQVQRYKNNESLCSGCSMGCSCSKLSQNKAKGKRAMNGASGHSCCARPSGDLKYTPKKQ